MKRPASNRTLLITCEHGGVRIPAAYRAAFRGWETRLRSHRGYDRGALDLARRMARACRAPLIAADVSRLLVDLNRGENHPRLFSEAVAALPAADRARIVARYHRPHRDRVEAWIAARVAAGGQVLHVAVHTFTPVLRGRRRRMDLGLLYDPARAGERRTAAAWAAALRQSPDRAWRVRLNAPYRGVADGLPTALRRRFPAARYTGIELEVNQRHVRADRIAPALVRDIIGTLIIVCKSRVD